MTDLHRQKEAPQNLRRIGRIGAGAALISMAGCKQVQERIEAITGNPAGRFVALPRLPQTPQMRQILNRVAYGARPSELARASEMGAKAYLEEQLSGALEEDPLVAWRINGLETRERTEYAPEALNDLSNDQLLHETEQVALLRALYSKRQLQETLADFWTNHFNIYALKNNERELIPVDAERVIRPHILGDFRKMLLASAHSPAMLSYLDNQANRKGVANENYARELLELHTLGVHGGYTQKDIQEVARCFTGWRLRTSGDLSWSVSRGLRSPYDGFLFDSGLHDKGAKFVPFLNLHIAPNGGKGDADLVLERLAAHPVTARFLATKLCRRYLGTTPPEIIERAANAYLKNNTSIQAMLRPILLDALPDPKQRRPLFKRPLDFLVSALRVLGADTNANENIQKYLLDMGQPLYQWPMPDGFPEKAASWTGSLLGRWNFALALTSQKIEGTSVDLKRLFSDLGAKEDSSKTAALLETVLQTPIETPEMQRLQQKILRHVQKARSAGGAEESLWAEAAALAISAPEFQWK